MRLTLYSIPQTEELLKTSNLPLGLIVQPLAKLRYDEVMRSNLPSSFEDIGKGLPRTSLIYLSVRLQSIVLISVKKVLLDVAAANHILILS